MRQFLKNHGPLIGIFIFFIILPKLTSISYYIYLMALAGVYTIMAVSLTLLTGISGQISIGHGALMAIGAYSSALLTTKLDFPFLLALIAAGLITSLLGLLFGFPALRLEGHFLALATLGLAVAVPGIVTKWESLTGGSYGIHLSKLTIFDYVMEVQDKYYIILLVCALVIWGVTNLLKTNPGRALIALRDSEIAARAMGINIIYYKVAAFALSSFIAGLAGSLYAHLIGYISPQDFSGMVSINILLMIVIGGTTSIPGAVLGAVYMTIMPELTSRTKGLGMAVNGGLVILLILFLPNGLIDIYYKILSKIKHTFKQQLIEDRGEVNK